MEEEVKVTFNLTIDQDATATTFKVTVPNEVYSLSLPSVCSWQLAREVSRLFYEEIVRLEYKAVLENQAKADAEPASEVPAELIN